MKKLILLILLLPSVVFAHDVDKEQEREKHLGFQNEEFFEAWFAYWHERRGLVKDMLAYSDCVGGIKTSYRVLGWGEFTGGSPDILTYWDLVPAIPLVEKPGDMHNAAEHLKAALTGRAIFQGHVQACENYRQFLESYTYYLLGAK